MNFKDIQNMSVTQKSRFFSLIFTCFIWLVMFIVFLFVKQRTNEQKFKEIQIVLDSVKKLKISTDNFNKTSFFILSTLF